MDQCKQWDHRSTGYPLSQGALSGSNTGTQSAVWRPTTAFQTSVHWHRTPFRPPWIPAANRHVTQDQLGYQRALRPFAFNRRAASTPYGVVYYQNRTSGYCNFTASRFQTYIPGYQQNYQGPHGSAEARPTYSYYTASARTTAMASAVSASSVAVTTGDPVTVLLNVDSQTSTSISNASVEPAPCPSVLHLDPTQDAVSTGKLSEESEPDVSREATKPPGMKVGKIENSSKGITKMKLNAALCKILKPTNPIMLLHELYPGLKFAFMKERGFVNEDQFIAAVEVNGKKYARRGGTTFKAKLNVADCALRDILLEQMCESGKMAMAASGGPRASKDNSAPWSTLASYAIYRLISDCCSGTDLPVPTWPATPDPIRAADSISHELLKRLSPRPMKNLPANAKHISPVMLLNQMHPEIQYECIAEWKSFKTFFTMKVTVKGKNFTGKGHSKKLAKHAAAKAALTDIYQIQYE